MSPPVIISPGELNVHGFNSCHVLREVWEGHNNPEKWHIDPNECDDKTGYE